MDAILRILVIFLSVFAAFIPMVAYLLFIWWMDRYLRQPLWMVAAVFVWGAFGAIALGIFGSQILEMPMARVFGNEATNALGAVFVAPFVEEISKGAILLLLAMRVDFNSVADGVVFGAAAGLGFGMTENFLYFTQVYTQSGFHAWMENVYLRTLYSAVMHCVATSTFGMSIGFAKFRRSGNGPVIVFAGLLSAMALHGFWNLCMVVGGALQSGWIMEIGFGVLPFLVLLMFALYQLSLYYEGRIIRNELQEEAKMGTIPLSLVPVLSSYFKRRQEKWYPAGVNQDRYVSLAMSIAFKRQQWKTASPRRRKKLETSLSELRGQILGMI
jgi:protease PrsW